MNKHQLYHNYGQAPKGERTKRIPQLNAGLSYKLLPAISMDVLIAFEVKQRGYHRVDLEEYLSVHLVSGTLIIHSVR